MSRAEYTITDEEGRKRMLAHLARAPIADGFTVTAVRHEPKPAPAEVTNSAARAIEEAEDAATSPDRKEPPTTLIETAKGAEAWAEAFSAWYRSLTRAERKTIGDTFDTLAERASRISDPAQNTITDAMNAPAADDEIGG